ncbi:MAG: hypothetical protein JSS02_05155 [Planctomycetes bacterium]|nr:hypothetical protein [Planctomycetota bacterium]
MQHSPTPDITPTRQCSSRSIVEPSAPVSTRRERVGRALATAGLCSSIAWLACCLETTACAADPFPYRQAPINYFSEELADPISELQQQLDLGKIRLDYDTEHQTGYLPALLKSLGISPNSQMLVFAKNSVNARIISPQNPRALYFNDTVYVGFVPGAPFLEISSVDPHKGAVFFTLSQKSDRPVRFAREDSCLLCHASSQALSVPGHLVRSFLTDADGNPTRGHSRITHETPFAQRWGGFYVTGDFGDLPHQGNLSTAADLIGYERNREGPGRTVDLPRRIDAKKYPVAHSDVVALLVHEHQTHGHNLLTRVNYEYQFRKDEEPVPSSLEDLVRYLLFAQEPPLENPVLGSTGYETWFTKLGPHDKQGRSLRQFDLETRLFKYRLSYLIYTAAFEQLPEPVRLQIFRRLWDILSADNPAAPFDKLSAPERRAIREIVAETRSNLPDFWKP